MQTFKLEIYGESPDGKSIKSEIRANIACEKEMALSLIVKLLNHDPGIKEMFTQALVLSVMRDEISESITDKEYYNKVDESEEDKDLDL